jgi:hypothetical protein
MWQERHHAQEMIGMLCEKINFLFLFSESERFILFLFHFFSLLLLVCHFGILGFELRASHLQSGHCITSAMFPKRFSLVILETGSCFLLRPA